MDSNPRHFKYVLVVSSLTFNEHYSKVVTSKSIDTSNSIAISTLKRYVDFYYAINKGS